MADMQKITPFLWFDGNAEQAVAHYRSVLGGTISRVVRTTEAGPGTEGRVLVIAFELAGQSFLAMNGGPGHPFSDAISLSVDCQTQDEVDRYWAGLSEGGATSVCGWLKDRFGVSWQIVPRRLPELLADPDRAKAARAMKAMMGMTKIDIAALERAAAATE